MKNKIERIVYFILTILMAGAVHYFFAVSPPHIFRVLFRGAAFVVSICALFCLFIEWSKNKRSGENDI